MLPIVRQIGKTQITDTAFSDLDNITFNVSKSNKTSKINTPRQGIRQIVVLGRKSGIHAVLRVKTNPTLPDNQAFVSNAQQYNKIYFDFSGIYAAKKSEVWEITAEYIIFNNR